MHLLTKSNSASLRLCASLGSGFVMEMSLEMPQWQIMVQNIKTISVDFQMWCIQQFVFFQNLLVATEVA